jgi:hypothetical protein
VRSAEEKEEAQVCSSFWRLKRKLIAYENAGSEPDEVI